MHRILDIFILWQKPYPILLVVCTEGSENPANFLVGSSDLAVGLGGGNQMWGWLTLLFLHKVVPDPWCELGSLVTQWGSQNIWKHGWIWLLPFQRLWEDWVVGWVWVIWRNRWWSPWLLYCLWRCGDVYVEVGPWSLSCGKGYKLWEPWLEHRSNTRRWKCGCLKGYMATIIFLGELGGFLDLWVSFSEGGMCPGNELASLSSEHIGLAHRACCWHLMEWGLS